MDIRFVRNILDHSALTACSSLVFSDNLLLKWNESVVVFSKKWWRWWRRDQLPTIFHFCSKLNSENLYYLQCYIIQLYIPTRVLHPFAEISNSWDEKRWEKEIGDVCVRYTKHLKLRLSLYLIIKGVSCNTCHLNQTKCVHKPISQASLSSFSKICFYFEFRMKRISCL